MTDAPAPPRSLNAPTRLRVRELLLPEIDIRIDYFHASSDEHLLMLGVDRTLPPSPRAWREIYQVDFLRPIGERQNYTLAWELDERVIGFSSLDHIAYGDQAFMHLHILATADRHTGMGTTWSSCPPPPTSEPLTSNASTASPMRSTSLPTERSSAPDSATSSPASAAQPDQFPATGHALGSGAATGGSEVCERAHRLGRRDCDRCVYPAAGPSSFSRVPDAPARAIRSADRRMRFPLL